jgi:hypothetical protein
MKREESKVVKRRDNQMVRRREAEEVEIAPRFISQICGESDLGRRLDNHIESIGCHELTQKVTEEDVEKLVLRYF